MRIFRRSRLGLLLVVAIAAALTAAPAALAEGQLSDPSSGRSDPPISKSGIAGGLAGGGDRTAPGSSASGADGLNDNIGALPFTGFDVIIVFGVALILTGTGLALRRLSMPPGTRI